MIDIWRVFMLDFNTKKEILRRLKAKRSKNKLLWLPCVTAELFIKLWYAFLCRADMALSDKNGKFLGIKQPKEKKGIRRQDDIVFVKKPFWGRLMSAVLAASFVMMFVPELGISFEVEAAITATTTVDGVDYVYDPNSGSNDNYYRKDEFDSASARTIDPSLIDYDVGYGAVRVTWGLGSLNIELIDNVYIELVDTASGRVIESDTVRKDASEKIFKGIDASTSVRVRLAPTTLIDRYKYTPANPDDPNSTAKITLEQKDGFAVNGQAAIKDIGRLDATFDPPVLRILNENGEEIDDCGIVECNSGKIKLTWNQVGQVGGTDQGKAPDGYVIYRYDMNNKRFTEKAVKSSDDPVSYAVSDITPGTRYQFFIEAYRNVWGRDGYNKNSEGIISSSKGDTNTDGENKLNMIYSDVAKNLYIAPASPSLIIDDSNPKAKSIKLSWPSSNGIFDGVEKYRSVGELDPQKIPEVANGSVTFAEWLKNQSTNSSPDYVDNKITGVGKIDFEKAITDVEDTTSIAEGVQYYYYAIAYIRKDNQAKIYSVPTIRAAKLELKLSRTTLTIINSDGKADISWEPVEGADGYDLEITQRSKYDPVAKKVVPLNPAVTINREIESGTSFSHTELYNGEQFTYRVRPYVWIETSTGSKPYYGEYCDPRNVTIGFGLDAPENVTADGSKDGQITVKWDAVTGATGYTLYFKNKTTGETKTFKTTKTTYTQTNLVNEHVCEYYVVAYKTININGSDGVQTIESDPSGIVTVKVGTALTTPQDLKAVAADGSISVTWTAVKGAEGYLLHYKYNKKNGASSGYTEETVFDVTKPSYVHSGLNNGDRYTYYVEAYKEVSGERVFSPQSDEAWAIVGVPLDAPKDFSGTTKDGIVDLKWTASKGAEGYELYFRKNGGAWEHVDVSKPGFQHIGLSNGDRYEYYVTAYKTVNGERVYSSESNHLSFKIGDDLNSPKDFTAVTSDGQVSLTWTAVKGAEGYILYAYGGGRSYQFDLSKPSYIHTGLSNGDSWTYYVVAYKTVNGLRVYSTPTKSITVTTGVSLNSVVDLSATAGNRQIDLSWTKVNGAEGYVIYLYNSKTMEFEPITVITGTKYSHTGLKNGQKYTYMVAPYKTINGERFYGEYSMSVSATPSTGLDTDIDNTLTIRGTTPYGISHSEYIDASANHAAFDEPVDVYFTTNRESTEAVKDVLKHYADGLKSFIIYPFDISIYSEGTKIEVDPNDGYTVTITMPIPDRLIAYRDYITVVHIGDGMEDTDEIKMDDAEDWIRTADTTLEVLPCAVVDIDNVWCIQFVCSSFSPYALVIYKDHISDVSSGGGILNGDFAGSFNSGVLLFTALPDIMPHNKKLKVVQGGKKRYHIKNVEKR